MASTRAPESGSRRARWRHRLFQVAMVGKGVDGLVEVAGGALLWMFGLDGLGGAVRFLTAHELAEDPRDLLAGQLVRHTRGLAASTVHFVVAYLLVHGVVKLWLVGGLIRERRWVFPVALVVLGLFVLVQGFRLERHFTGGLLALTVLDVAILGLVWREYRALGGGIRTSPAPPG